MTVELKEDVDTVHVRGRSEDRGRCAGRYLNSSVDDEKSVKPVSLGDSVTAVKNWNLVD